MSDRNPFHGGGNEAMPWALGFGLDSSQHNDCPDMNTDFFSDLINPDGLANTHHTHLPIDPSAEPSSYVSPNRDPEASTTTTTPNSIQDTEHALPSGVFEPERDEIKHTPATESTNGDVGEQKPREKKRRRSRNSPEPDYSQIILELNKKRKRTGQACDRCRVRRYRCDPSRNGCVNCRVAGRMCEVTDCVTGETYVRGAAGRMAAEVDRLKARIAELERENDDLQRNTKPYYGYRPPNALPGTTFASAAILHRQQQQRQYQGNLQEQQINRHRIENTKLLKRVAILKGNPETLQKQIKE
ncbi:uncharacterized protein N7496_001015 [Penicillium cataractarum]|uniref:Zn(2)-C6 fungal-type domain-containing protein n=1 Tax=Penicillium cataractarum TaxID=2100454 RepID=A0A9X0B6P0_9EURO|nr:uncharacterized protein N7496_001015 [Penicillium cataractarum]KAJ5389947.1 hypothetical protein N7496_001015 [Penicillium cataractarum]